MRKGCRCKGAKENIMQNWEVVDYKCNYSAFSGHKRTNSDYSAMRCNECGARWRTKSYYSTTIFYKQNWPI